MSTQHPSRIPTRKVSQRLRHRRRDWQWSRRLVREGVFPNKAGKDDANFPGLAVATIALQAKYHDWCLSMIDSLRRRGNFQGPVYVVTENPEIFADLDNVQTVKVPFTRVRPIAKSCKQRLIDWVHEARILYIDADVIIGKPMMDWYRRATSRLSTKPLVLYTGNMPVAGAYHGGLMLMDRERVQPFFKRWLALIRTGRYLLDQQSLHVIRDERQITTFDDNELVYLNRVIGADRADCDAHEHGANIAPATFVHVTDGMIQKHSADEIKGYLKRVVGLQRVPTRFGREA